VDLSMRFPSIDEFATGYFLTRKGMAWFRSHYLESPAQADDPELRFSTKTYRACHRLMSSPRVLTPCGMKGRPMRIGWRSVALR